MEPNLLQQLRIEPSKDIVLMRRITIGLKRRNQRAQPRCQNNQIASIASRCVSMGHTRRHKHGRSRSGRLGPVAVAKLQLAFQNMPRLVIRVVHVKHRRTAATPLMNLKRLANR